MKVHTQHTFEGKRTHGTRWEANAHGWRQMHTQHTVGREDQYLLCAAALLVCWALLLRAATSRWAVSWELQPVRVLLLLFPTSGSDFSSGRAKLS